MKTESKLEYVMLSTFEKDKDKKTQNTKYQARYLTIMTRKAMEQLNIEFQPAHLVIDEDINIIKAVKKLAAHKITACLCRHQYITLIKRNLKDNSFFPLLESKKSKESKSERKERLSDLCRKLILLSQGLIIGNFHRSHGIPSVNRSVEEFENFQKLFTQKNINEFLIKDLQLFIQTHVVNTTANLNINPEVPLSLQRYSIHAMNYANNQPFDLIQQYILRSRLKKPIVYWKNSETSQQQCSNSRNTIGYVYFKDNDFQLRLYKNFSFLKDIQETVECYFQIPQSQEIKKLVEINEITEDKLFEIMKIRSVKLVQIGGDSSGKYDLECDCDDYYDMKECLHFHLIRLNLKRVEEIQCYEDIEERKQMIIQQKNSKSEGKKSKKKKRDKKAKKKDKQKDKKYKKNQN
ncbi:UNKNOWN [Stylonychia lemnae]|uniref:SWIM-type domain-containing protein n=1 Tax=Stylonychia lemnae TaxID=5949 RepID=A0A078B5C2_STYLE|nr:UNKNOWN [Stylonychia lemnae]|eukprot:CDW89386.1 UNKNOWN [Stylonychia lemnae]